MRMRHRLSLHGWRSPAIAYGPVCWQSRGPMACSATILATLAGILTGYAAGTNAVGKVDEFCEIRDMTSRTVRIPRVPSRVLSLCTAATDIIVAMGETNRLAAIDEYSRILPGTEGIPVIGKGSAISREAVIARRIDLAFVWWYQNDVAAQLAQVGVPTVRLRSGRAADVPETIRFVGECLDRRAAADALAQSVERFLRDVRPAAGARPRVYLELYGPFKTAGRDTYINDLIELAGGTNVASTAKGGVLLSPEHLLQVDPEIILFVRGFSSATDITRRGGMAGLSTVQAGRIYPVERNCLVAGTGMPQAVEKLRAVIHASDGTTEDGNGIP